MTSETPAAVAGTPPGPVGDGLVVLGPGDDAYERSTRPHNTRISQAPGLVAVPTDARQLADCVRLARDRGLVVVPQATGHGAAEPLGDDVLLVDTSRLVGVDVDGGGRRAVVGAGARWGTVNDATSPYGLLGRSGSAPSVGITGFTFGAGAGWLTRPYGLASGSLRAVEYVDGSGRVRRAADDAEDALDREVIWACRGGGGAGLAVSLEVGLVPVGDLWAGYLLWPLGALDAVVDAWVTTIGRVGPSLATSIAVLRAPPSPAVPAQLHGQQVVHLALASTAGSGQADPLLTAISGAPRPALTTWGPSDAVRLAQIHLDPPGPVPALGRGRWLDRTAPEHVAALLHAAVGTPLAMVEVRNVGNDAEVYAGAMDRPPGPFMVQAVGSPVDETAAGGVDLALDTVLATTAPADTGLAIASWTDRARVPDGLPPEVRERVRSIVDAVDPDGVLRRSKVLRGESRS